MRISAKVDYAVRAAVELAGAEEGEPMKGDALADAQGIPLKFLENILGELKHAGISRSQRGAEGGYWLARPADEITLADVIRAVEGPLASVRGESPEALSYDGRRGAARGVWVAVRANLRAVLETVTLADLAAGDAARGCRRAHRATRGLGTAAVGAQAAAPLTRAVRAPGARRRSGPRASSSSSASSRVICAQTWLPSESVSSTRTSKPRWTIRSIIASSVGAVRLEQHLEVVRADELVAEPVDRPDEAHHELVRGVLVEVARRADLLDPAVVHHHDLLGDVHRLLLVVGDEDRRHVDLVVQAAQPDAQVLAHARVERAERLVEQQHLGLDRERPGERHALALAAGELRRVAVARSRRGARARAARRRARAISSLGRLRIFSPKATLSRTVMCLNAA